MSQTVCEEKAELKAQPIDIKTDNIRYDYIDIMKCIGILLMVFHHCSSVSDGVFKIILSFHMPLFFFVSGYLFKKQEKKLDLSEKGLNIWFGKKVKALLIPYAIFVFLNIIIRMICTAAGYTPIKGRSETLYFLITFGGMWFLMALLIASVVFMILYTKIKSTWGRAIAVIIIFCFGIAYSAKFGGKEYAVVSASVGLLIYFCGYLWSGIAAHIEKKIYYAVIALVSIAGLIFFNGYNNTAVMMFKNVYGNTASFVLCSIFGSIAVYSVSRLISHCKPLEFFGRNSLIIVMFNFPIFKILGYITKRVLPSGSWSYTVTNFVVCVLFLIPCVLFVNKFLPICTGKIKIRR